jgi:sulfur-carrier protein
MKVNFYATLREIVGQKCIEFPIKEGDCVRDLMNKMIHRFPDLESELLDEQGDLLGHVHLFVNGRDLPYLDDGMETELSIEDQISVFPAVGGGMAASELVCYSREVRGIPLWLLQEYLQELGGQSVEEGFVLGRGWQARLSPRESYKLGSLSVGQVFLEIEATKSTFEQILPKLDKKLLRCGG